MSSIHCNENRNICHGNVKIIHFNASATFLLCHRSIFVETSVYFVSILGVCCFPLPSYEGRCRFITSVRRQETFEPGMKICKDCSSFCNQLVYRAERRAEGRGFIQKKLISPDGGLTTGGFLGEMWIHLFRIQCLFQPRPLSAYLCNSSPAGTSVPFRCH